MQSAPSTSYGKSRNRQSIPENVGNSTVLITEDTLTRINVPRDGNCLFWSVALAYLIPFKNNEKIFREKFKNLFGSRNENQISFVQKLIRDNSLDIIYNDTVVVELVTRTLRSRVLTEIAKNVENNYQKVNLDDILRMKNEVFITGGAFLELFKSVFPSQIHSLDVNKLKPEFLNEKTIEILNDELEKILDGDKVQRFKFHAYFESMKSCNSFGGNLEIQALKTLLNCQILIFSSNSNAIKFFNPEKNNNVICLFNSNQNLYKFGLAKIDKIIESIKSVNYKQASLLVKIGADSVNYYQDEIGWTALHYAVTSDNCKNLVNALIWQNADFNIKNKSDQTPLDLAILFDHQKSIAAIEAVLPRLDINCLSLNTNEVKHESGTKKLIPKEKIHTRKQNKLVENDQSDAISLRFLKLHPAVLKNNVEMVEFLIAIKANVNAVENITEMEHFGVKQYFDGASVTALHCASQLGYLDVAKILIEKGKAEVDFKDSYGRTPLQRAVEFGHLHVVKFLLKKGADKNFVDKTGCSLLIYAAKTGKDPIVYYLLEKGTEIDAVDRDGNTALHHAVISGHWSSVQCLVEHKADLNMANADNKTPLLLIIIDKNCENWDMIRYFLENGALLTGLLESVKDDIYKKFILDLDEDHWLRHAIALGNVELFERLMTSLSLTNKIEDLYETVFEIYNEFLVCNLSMTSEMCVFIENRLMSERYYSENQVTEDKIKDVFDVDNIKRRIELVLKWINKLLVDYSGNKNEADDLFLFIGKFICKNLHILKNQLKSTYDIIPWEEMQFCFISFLSSYENPHETDICVSLVLNQKRILDYLSIFNSELAKLLKMKELLSKQILIKDRKVIKEQIISSVQKFRDLYEDYELLKDAHSLFRIERYLKIAISVDLKKNPEIGKLVIERALQVMGEALKNTLESPNLSEKLRNELYDFSILNVKNTVSSLRDALSHIETLTERFRMENSKNVNYFTSIQNDLKNVKSEITYQLYRKKNEIGKLFFKKIINCENDDQLDHLINGIRINDTLDFVIEDDNYIIFQKIADYTVKLKNEIKSRYSKFVKEEEFQSFDIVLNEARTRISRMQNTHFSILNKINLILDLTRFKLHSLKDIKDQTRAILNVFLDVDGLSVLQSVNVLLSIIIGKIEKIPRSEKVFEKIYNAISYETRHLKGIGNFTFNLLKKREIKSHSADKLINQINDQFLIFFDELSDAKLRDKISVKYEAQKNFYQAKNTLIKFFEEKPILKTISECEFYDLIKKINFRLVKKDNESARSLYEEDDLIKCSSIIQRINQRTKIEPFEKLVNKLIENPENDDFLKETGAFFESFKPKNKVSSSNLNHEINVQPNNNVILKKYFFEKMRNLESIFDFTKRDSEILKMLRTKNEVRAAAEMLILILTEILENLFIFGSNKIFLDEILPLLIGKNLRNYLAHGELLIDILSIDYLKCMIYHMRAIGHDCSKSERIVYKGEKRIGRKTIENVDKIDKQFEKNLQLIINHKMLEKALREDNIDLFSKSVAHGVETFHKNANGRSFLCYAIRTDNLVAFNGLFSDRRLNIYYRDKFNYSILYYMIKFDSKSIFKEAMKNIDPNFILHRGKSLLHLSAEFGRDDLTHYLLHAIGVNKNDIDDEGFTPIQRASKNKHPNVVSTLFLAKAIVWSEFEDTVNEAQIATLIDNEDVIKKLIKHSNPTWYLQSLFLVACKLGNLKCVQFLLENNVGLNVNTRDGTGVTALCRAALFNHYEVVKLLLVNLADINLANSDGSTVLHAAASNAHTHVHFLIENGADVNAINNENSTPLHRAASLGNCEVVKTLLSMEALVNCVDNDNMTALHCALLSNHTKTIAVLLTNGADANASSQYISPLRIASGNGNVKIIEMLLAHKADINFVRKDGVTALTDAIDKGRMEAVKCLLNNGATIGNYNLHDAANSCNIDILKLLIENDAIFIKDRYGDTPLHFSVSFGHEEGVEALITKYQNIIDWQNVAGKTALHLAAVFGNIKIVDILLRNGANVNLTDVDSRTALHCAIHKGHCKVVEKLLIRKARSDVKKSNGLTAMHSAAYLGFTNIIKLLLKANKKIVDIEDDDGNTPLHFSCQEGHLAAAKLLINNGANVKAKSKNNFTTLEYVALNGHWKLVELLIDHGAEMNENSNGDSLTAINYAILKGYTHIVQILLKKGARIDKNAIVSSVTEGRAGVLSNFLKNGVVDVNANVNGAKLLCFAAANGQNRIVEILLKNGANVNEINKYTPMHYASANGHHEIIKILHKHKAQLNAKDIHDYTPLHRAAEGGHPTCIIYLLLFGADNNAAGENSFTPIHFASFNGHAESVRALIHHADRNLNLINRKEKRGRTALYFAAAENQIDVANCLLKAGADVNCSEHFLLPLHLAIRNGNLEMVRLLSKSENNVNFKFRIRCKFENTVEGLTYEGFCTTLHFAVKFNHPDIKIRFPVQVDPNSVYDGNVLAFILNEIKVQTADEFESVVNAPDSLGNTPLMRAVDDGNAYAAKLLLECNEVDVNKQNVRGNTALHRAAYFGNSELADLLVRRKANVNLKNEKGYTAFIIACAIKRANTQTNILKLLLR